MSVRTVLLLSFSVLSAVRSGVVTSHEACLKSTGHPVRVTCPGDGDRIQVNRVVYSHYANLSASTGCDTGDREFRCKVDARVPSSTPLWKPIHNCYGKQNCTLIFGGAGRYGCGYGFLNHVRMHYSCVQVDRLVDLCGNLWRNINTTTQLSYLSESGKVSRDCKCAVMGGHHVLKLIFVVLPKATLNCKMNLTIAWNKTIREWDGMEYAKDVDILGIRESSTIHMVGDCKKSVNTIVWLQITPDPGVSLSLNCGQYATTKSTEWASEKPTTAGAAAEEVTQKAHNTGVVAGAALGGVALVVCLAVLAVVLCKKRRQTGGLEGSVSGNVTANTCDGAVDGVVVADNKAFVSKEEDDYGGYHTVGGPHGNHTLETLSSPDSSVPGNLDQPRTPIARVGAQQTTTAIYDHIGSVPNANKKLSVSDEDHDDHYNTPNLDRQPVGVSQKVDDAQTRVDQGERTSDGSDKRTKDPIYAQHNK